VGVGGHVPAPVDAVGTQTEVDAGQEERIQGQETGTQTLTPKQTTQSTLTDEPPVLVDLSLHAALQEQMLDTARRAREREKELEAAWARKEEALALSARESKRAAQETLRETLERLDREIYASYAEKWKLVKKANAEDMRAREAALRARADVEIQAAVSARLVEEADAIEARYVAERDAEVERNARVQEGLRAQFQAEAMAAVERERRAGEEAVYRAESARAAVEAGHASLLLEAGRLQQELEGARGFVLGLQSDVAVLRGALETAQRTLVERTEALALSERERLELNQRIEELSTGLNMARAQEDTAIRRTKDLDRKLQITKRRLYAAEEAFASSTSRVAEAVRSIERGTFGGRGDEAELPPPVPEPMAVDSVPASSSLVRSAAAVPLPDEGDARGRPRRRLEDARMAYRVIRLDDSFTVGRPPPPPPAPNPRRRSARMAATRNLRNEQ